MYNVLDVAIYVINYAHDTGCGESMSNLKLQKILYYHVTAENRSQL